MPTLVSAGFVCIVDKLNKARQTDKVDTRTFFDSTRKNQKLIKISYQKYIQSFSVTYKTNWERQQLILHKKNQFILNKKHVTILPNATFCGKQRKLTVAAVFVAYKSKPRNSKSCEHHFMTI